MVALGAGRMDQPAYREAARRIHRKPGAKSFVGTSSTIPQILPLDVPDGAGAEQEKTET